MAQKGRRELRSLREMELREWTVPRQAVRPGPARVCPQT